MQERKTAQVAGGGGLVPWRKPVSAKASHAHWPAMALRSLRDRLVQAADMRRLFILLPFSIVFGLALYASLPGEPELLALIIGSLSVAVWLGSAFARRSLVQLRLSGQIAAIWFGFCLLPLHGFAFGTDMLAFPAYGDFTVRVDEVLSADAESQRVVVSAILAGKEARQVPIRRARLLLPAEPRVQIGDTIQGPFRFAPIPGPVLPDTYDGQFHSFFSGIGAYGSATGPVQISVSGDDKSFGRRIQALRSFIADRIDGVLEGDSAAIGRAMTVGDQSAITDETRDVMAASGLAHVYSISGLHLSIVAGGMFWLVRLVLAVSPVALVWPIKHIAAIIGLLAAFIYLMLSGGVDNVPAFRSTLMLALIFGAVLVGRQALTMRNVAIAALVIIVIDPASIFRASFQLSFAAVVALIGVYELPGAGSSGSKGQWQRLTHFVFATGWTSFVAGSATLLFSAYHFQQTAPLGVLGNLLALPFVGMIMWFGLLALLAMPLGLEQIFLALMGWNIDRMVDVAELVAGWSEHLTGNPLLMSWTLLAGLIALAWFAFLKSRWRLALPALLIPVVIMFGLAPRPDVLIADTTQAVAVRDGDSFALVSGRLGSFAVDVWSEHYQTEMAAQHPAARCDSLGCILDKGDYRLAVVRNAAAFAEDCFGTDLVIARVLPPAACAPGKQVIGPAELSRGGVHWLRWDSTAGRFDIRQAIVGINRPWRAEQR